MPQVAVFLLLKKLQTSKSGDKNDRLVLKNPPRGSLRGDRACEEAPRRLETDQFARKEGNFRRGGAAPAASNAPKTCRLIDCRQLNGLSVCVSGGRHSGAHPDRPAGAKGQLRPRASGERRGGRRQRRDGIMVSQLKLPAEER